MKRDTIYLDTSVLNFFFEEGDREAFYKETKGRDSEYILNRIKEDSKKMQQELKTTQPDPKLIVRERPRIKQFDSMDEIHQIRERDEKYGK